MSDKLDYLTLTSLADDLAPSFFILDTARLRQNFANFSGALGETYSSVRVAYSYKTNYTPTVCREIDDMGGLAEVVSGMEWQLAKRIGVKSRNVVYNGPNKSEQSFQAALSDGAIVQLDNERDWRMLEALSMSQPGRDWHFGIRVNFECNGTSSRFGMDVEGELFRHVLRRLDQRRNLVLDGLHCHFPHRDVQSFDTRIRRMIFLSKDVFTAPPRYINIGGGFFGEMDTATAAGFGVAPVSFRDYAEVIGPALQRAYPDSSTSPILIVEPGTAIVADAMKFVTRVIDIRVIRGRTIATVDGSIFNTSPYSRSRRLPVRVVSQGGGAAVTGGVDVAGFTCIESDLLVEDLQLGLAVGDFLIFSNVGSYSVVMKPPFILPSPPMVATNDWMEFVMVRRAETVDDLMTTFVAV